MKLILLIEVLHENSNRHTMLILVIAMPFRTRLHTFIALVLLLVILMLASISIIEPTVTVGIPTRVQNVYAVYPFCKPSSRDKRPPLGIPTTPLGIPRNSYQIPA